MRLAAETDFSVIGEATDGQAALDLTTSLRPDVVLMDVDMPRLDGIATASALRLMCPQTSVIMLSFRDDVLTRPACGASRRGGLCRQVYASGYLANGDSRGFSDEVRPGERGIGLWADRISIFTTDSGFLYKLVRCQ